MSFADIVWMWYDLRQFSVLLCTARFKGVGFQILNVDNVHAKEN